MKLKYSHEDCYKILGASPGSSWESIRKIYKTQIQKFHPDKFKDGSVEEKAAGEKIRALNSAYQQLSDYYRKNGTLPDIESTKEPVNYNRKSVFQADRTPQQAKNGEFNKSSNNKHTIHKRNSYKTRLAFIILVAGILFFIFPELSDNHKTTETRPSKSEQLTNTKTQKTHNSFLSHQSENTIRKQDNPAKQQNITSQLDNNKPSSPKNITEDNDGEYFTYGSTIGEVILIQGTPTKTQNDAWFYGDSIVYFYEGKVTKWKRAPGSPLKARAYGN